MGNEIVPVVDKDMTQILDPEEQQRSRNDAKKRQKMQKVVNAMLKKEKLHMVEVDDNHHCLFRSMLQALKCRFRLGEDEDDVEIIRKLAQDFPAPGAW